MTTRRAALYLRVSTDEQQTAMQEQVLLRYAKQRGWKVFKVYSDKGISGTSEKRPALDHLFADCRAGKFDVVLVWKFDRFARSLPQLITALEFFRRYKVDFVSSTEAVDTSLPSGELVFQIFGAIAQFERALISERVRAGLVQARRNGKRIGRPALRQLTTDEIRKLRSQRRRGQPLRQLASTFGISLWMAHQLTTHGV